MLGMPLNLSRTNLLPQKLNALNSLKKLNLLKKLKRYSDRISTTLRKSHRKILICLNQNQENILLPNLFIPLKTILWLKRIEILQRARNHLIVAKKMMKVQASITQMIQTVSIPLEITIKVSVKLVRVKNNFYQPRIIIVFNYNLQFTQMDKVQRKKKDWSS